MKRLLFNKFAFALAAVAIFLVGMLRDPDLAKGDDLDAGPVPHESMPGYQCDTDSMHAQALSKAEIAKLNTADEASYATF